MTVKELITQLERYGHPDANVVVWRDGVKDVVNVLCVNPAEDKNDRMEIELVLSIS